MTTIERLCSITIDISPTMSEKMRGAAQKRGLPYHVFCRLLFEAAWLAYVKPPSGDDGLDEMVARAVAAASSAKLQRPAFTPPPASVPVPALKPVPPKTIEVPIAVPLMVPVPVPIPIFVRTQVEKVVEVERVIEVEKAGQAEPPALVHLSIPAGPLSPETKAALEGLIRAALPIMDRVRTEKALAEGEKTLACARKAAGVLAETTKLQPMMEEMPVISVAQEAPEVAPLNQIQIRLVRSYQAAGMTIAEICKETGFDREAVQAAAGRK